MDRRKNDYHDAETAAELLRTGAFTETRLAEGTYAELRAAVLAMQSGASYVPAESDSLYEWWRTVVRNEGDL